MADQGFTDADLQLVAQAANDCRDDTPEQIARRVLTVLAGARRLAPPALPEVAGWPVPSIYIQWKGTDACLDFHCECGNHGHIDDMFVYGVRCSACGRVYELPDTLIPTLGEPANELVKDVHTEPWTTS